MLVAHRDLSSNNELDRLVMMVNRTNIWLLDKLLETCQCKVNFIYAAQRATTFKDRIHRAMPSIKGCLHG